MPTTTFRRFRPHLSDLENRWRGTTAVPQAPKTDGPIVKLDSNENPFPPQVNLALTAQGIEANRYPDSEMESIRQTLARQHGVDSECIVVGNGCDELIDLSIRMILEPGEAILNCPPTFIMYQRFTEVFGGEVIAIERDRDYQIRPQAIREAVAKDARARLLFLCSPNNPTGTVTPPEVVEQLIDLPIWIIADETYFSFSGKTLVEWMRRSDRFAVVRSLSKGYGLAGLRVGYGFFPQDLAALLRRVRPPYSVNILAQRAAESALANLSLWEPHFATLLSERNRLSRALTDCPHLRVFPSEGNFLFCETSHEFQSRLQSRLSQEAVAIRFLASPYSEAAFRVSVGTPAENNLFLDALRKAAE